MGLGVAGHGVEDLKGERSGDARGEMRARIEREGGIRGADDDVCDVAERQNERARERQREKGEIEDKERMRG
jgi:hypothetical protein